MRFVVARGNEHRMLAVRYQSQTSNMNSASTLAPHRQFGDADSCARSEARIAKNVSEEVGCAVGDRWLVAEALRRGDENGGLHDARDTVQRANLLADDCESLNRAEPGSLLGGRHIYIRAELAGMEDLAIGYAYVAGDEDKIAGADSRDVRPAGFRHRWQDDSEFDQP